MSMFDAVRKKLPSWLRTAQPEAPVSIPEPISVVDDIGELVRMARSEWLIDRQSGTWHAVTAWAARELLETMAKMESADDEKTIALRARAKTLRDMLAMEDRPQRPVKFESTAPYIP